LQYTQKACLKKKLRSGAITPLKIIIGQGSTCDIHIYTFFKPNFINFPKGLGGVVKTCKARGQTNDSGMAFIPTILMGEYKPVGGVSKNCGRS
jgi:hypothetical protein